jgi:hypothetical protein
MLVAWRLFEASHQTHCGATLDSRPRTLLSMPFYGGSAEDAETSVSASSPGIYDPPATPSLRCDSRVSTPAGFLRFELMAPVPCRGGRLARCVGSGGPSTDLAIDGETAGGAETQSCWPAIATLQTIDDLAEIRSLHCKLSLKNNFIHLMHQADLTINGKTAEDDENPGVCAVERSAAPHTPFKPSLVARCSKPHDGLKLAES